jgi:hypothetical protein
MFLIDWSRMELLVRIHNPVEVLRTLVPTTRYLRTTGYSRNIGTLPVHVFVLEVLLSSLSVRARCEEQHKLLTTLVAGIPAGGKKHGGSHSSSY